jgi:hypothetical protein
MCRLHESEYEKIQEKEIREVREDKEMREGKEKEREAGGREGMGCMLYAKG